MSDMRLYLGVDPGKHGGLSLVGPHREVVDTLAMPESIDLLVVEVMALTTQALDKGPRAQTCVAIVEHAQASPQMGVTSAFSYGKGFGALLGVLTALKWRIYLVRPVTWQTALKCRTGGEKNISKAAASRLFPRVKMTHAIADSLLIAHYGHVIQA